MSVFLRMGAQMQELAAAVALPGLAVKTPKGVYVRNPFVPRPLSLLLEALTFVLTDAEKHALRRLYDEIATQETGGIAPTLQRTDSLVALYATLPEFCEETSTGVANPTTQVRYILTPLGYLIARLLKD